MARPKGEAPAPGIWRVFKGLARRAVQCRRFEVATPPAASLFRNFKTKSGTRIITLLVPLCFRSSCQRVPRRITNFGSGALDPHHHLDAAVTPLVEGLVHCRAVFKPHPVGDYEG